MELKKVKLNFFQYALKNDILKGQIAFNLFSVSDENVKKILDLAKRGDFIYFDPPYFPISKSSSFTAYTANNFLENEQVELRDVYIELAKRGCYVMLSNSDCLYTNKLYENLEKFNIKIHKVEATRALNSKASARGKINEILVTNY